MAGDYDGTDDNLETNAVTITAYPFTMACWFNADLQTADGTLFAVEDKDVANVYYGIMAAGAQAGDPVRTFARNTTQQNADSTAGFTAGQWHHACGVFNSATDRRSFIDGANRGNNTNSVTLGAIDRTSIGRLGISSPISFFNGKLCELAIWNIALSDAEVALLAKAFSALMFRPESLLSYVQEFGKNSPEADLVGGLSFTRTGAVDFPHPRMIYPSGLLLPGKPPAAAGGGVGGRRMLLGLAG